MKLLILIFAAVQCWAAGTVTQTIDRLGSTDTYLIKIQWTGDSVDGTVPVTVMISNGSTLTSTDGMRIVMVETVPIPGLPSPTDGYAIQLKDLYNLDILSYSCTNRSSSVSQTCFPGASARPMSGFYNFTLTGNATPSAGGFVLVYINAAAASGSTQGPLNVGADISSNVPNPVLIGGRKTSDFTVTFATFDSNQALRVATVGSSPVSSAVTQGAGISANGYGMFLGGGASSGSTGGLAKFVTACDSSVAINVTAGNTTEVVSLTSGQRVRVCAYQLSPSIAGTVGIYQGTGTNCGTGTATIMQDSAIAGMASIGSGIGELFSTTAGSALCVKAVTGNITGVLTYAKY